MARFPGALPIPLVGMLCAMLFAPHADAQTYPVQTVTFIVPASNGSSMDILARQIAPILSKRFGQPVVVENRVDASGNIMSVVIAVAHRLICLSRSVVSTRFTSFMAECYFVSPA